jgi:hypothetical protein
MLKIPPEAEERGTGGEVLKESSVRLRNVYPSTF